MSTTVVLYLKALLTLAQTHSKYTFRNLETSEPYEHLNCYGVGMPIVTVAASPYQTDEYRIMKNLNDEQLTTYADVWCRPYTTFGQKMCIIMEVRLPLQPKQYTNFLSAKTWYQISYDVGVTINDVDQQTWLVSYLSSEPSRFLSLKQYIVLTPKANPTLLNQLNIAYFIQQWMREQPPMYGDEKVCEASSSIPIQVVQPGTHRFTPLGSDTSAQYIKQMRDIIQNEHKQHQIMSWWNIISVLKIARPLPCGIQNGYDIAFLLWIRHVCQISRTQVYIACEPIKMIATGNYPEYILDEKLTAQANVNITKPEPHQYGFYFINWPKHQTLLVITPEYYIHLDSNGSLFLNRSLIEHTVYHILHIKRIYMNVDLYSPQYQQHKKMPWANKMVGSCAAWSLYFATLMVSNLQMHPQMLIKHVAKIYNPAAFIVLFNEFVHRTIGQQDTQITKEILEKFDCLLETLNS